MDKTRDLIERFVASWAFPATFAILSFAGWVSKFPWPFAIIEALLCFFPLISGIGRAYQAPMLLFVPMISQDLSFNSIPYYAIMVGVCYVVSLVLYIFLNRCRFKASSALFSYLLLLFLFLLSIIINIAVTSTYESSAMFFMISMIAILLITFLNCNMMENHDDSYIYLADCICMLSILISLEIYSYYIWNSQDLYTEQFDIGWATTKSMVSTILSISLTAFSTLIYHKRWESLISLPAFAGMLLLATPSGLLTLIIGFIPLVLISFRSYGKAYPYISLFLSTAFVSIFSILLGFMEGFRNIFIESLHSLNLANSSNSPLYNYAIDGLRQNPVLGSSMQGLTGTIGDLIARDGMIVPLRNTIMTTAYIGGSLGLISFIACEIITYVTCIKRKSKDKWAFLLFLIVTDFVGLTDNTIYNLFFFTIYMLSIAAFENSSTYDRVKVNDSYYKLVTKNDY